MLQFAIGEQVVSETTGLTGVVRDWIDISETLTVLSKDDFKVGEVIRGVVSEAVETIEQTTDDQAEIITGLELPLFMVASQFLVFSIMISRNFPTMNIIRTSLTH